MTPQNPQTNTLLEWVNQVIYNIILTKSSKNKIFVCIDLWGKPLSYISWVIRASYHHYLHTTNVQYVLITDMIFNLSMIIDCKF